MFQIDSDPRGIRKEVVSVNYLPTNILLLSIKKYCNEIGHIEEVKKITFSGFFSLQKLGVFVKFLV